MNKVDEYKKEMTKLLNGFTPKYFIRNVFTDFIEMSGIALYNVYALDSDLEERFNKIKKKYTPEEFKNFPKLLGLTFLGIKAASENRFVDFLGDVYMQLDLGDESKDQYFTPIQISRLMADLTTTNESIKEKISEKSFVSVLEPTCGSGVNILGFAQKVTDSGYDIKRQMCAVGCDIDLTCVLMCYIQCELYGIPAKILYGNSVSNQYQSAWRTSTWCAYDFESRIRSIPEEKIKTIDDDEEKTIVIDPADIAPVLMSSSQMDNQQKIELLDQLALF